MDKKEYSVSEAVKLCGVPSHVLRYWEEELQLQIRRTSQGHRTYSREDISLFQKVKDLKEKGIQLKAIRVLLEEPVGSDFSSQVRGIVRLEEARTEAELSSAVRSGEMQSGESTDRKNETGSVRETRAEESPELETQTAGTFTREIQTVTASAKEAQTVTGFAGEVKTVMASAEGMQAGKEKEMEMQAETSQETDEEMYEVLVPDEQQAYQEQFKTILRNLMTEVLEEQNEKLEKAIAAHMRTELEDLYLQYYQLLQEAAPSRETYSRQKGLLERIRTALFGERH